jgi:hypothetical protein
VISSRALTLQRGQELLDMVLVFDRPDNASSEPIAMA